MTARPAPHPPTGCQGIVPPYLQERLSRSEDPLRARSASASIPLDRATRERRLRASGTVGAPPTAARRTGAHRAAEAPAPHRTVADTHGSTTLPGDVVRTEGAAATGDPAADEAYDGLGATWALYQEVYGRDSLDGHGLPLEATVHYGDHYDNAFWDGHRMVFGDGDGVTFTRFTVSVDVIGHELTHGVTEKTAGLVYQGQSGALNESISDVFGSLVRQRALGQDAASADWLIGAGLFTPSVHGVALRSMKAPGTAYDDPQLGKDPQPATMDGYVDTADDNGGVHTNSGIPNHAFYLAATAIGGNAWEGAGQVWYDVLTGGSLPTDADFATFAAATVAAATARFGEGSTQAAAVADAWSQVGVSTSSTSGPAAPGGDGAPGPGTVVVERSGGFAGRRVRRHVDLAALPSHEESAWRELLGSPLLRDLTTEPAQPDRFTYRVHSEQEGVDVTAAEQQLPDHVRELLERALHQAGEV